MPLFSGTNYYKPQDWINRADIYEPGYHNRMLEGWNQGQAGLADYNARMGKAQDPWATEAARQGFLGGMDQYAGALGGFQARPGYTGEQIAGMQYSPAEQQKMTMASTAPMAAASRAATEDMRNRAAASGSPTSYGPMAAKMARQRGQDIASVQGGLQGEFAKARMGAEEKGAEAEQRGRMYGLQAAQFGPQQFGAQQQREMGMLPLFQFGPEFAQKGYGMNQQALQNLMASRLKMAELSQQNAFGGGWMKQGIMPSVQTIGAMGGFGH